MKLPHLLLVLAAISLPAFAAGSAEPAMPSTQELEAASAALKECVGTVKKDANGIPEAQALIGCIQKKGYNLPSDLQVPTDAAARR